MNAKIINVALFCVLLCVFSECPPVPTRNAEQLQVDYAEIFKFFSEIPSSGQQTGSLGNIPKGTRSVIQGTTLLDATQITQLEQHTRNNPDEQDAHLKFRLTPEIFGSICLDKMTPEGLSAWLMSPRPRINLWSNEKIVKSLQAGLQLPINPSGLIVDKTRGYLAAIPDAMVLDRAVIKVIVTPLMRKDISLVKNFVEGELSPEKYLYYEIQGLLAITEKEHCILVIVSKEFIKPTMIKRNRATWSNMMVNKIEQLCTETFLPEPPTDRPPSVTEPFRDSLREKIREFLTCNVCTEVIKPPYKVCRNGHLLCHDCWPQLQRVARQNGELPKCPTCREPIPPKPSRCLPLEGLCNIIDPEVSPPPVVRPDDPMDVSSNTRASSPDSSEDEWNWGTPMNAVAFRRIVAPRRTPDGLRSSVEGLSSGLVRAPTIPSSPQLYHEDGRPGFFGSFESQSLSRSPHLFRSPSPPYFSRSSRFSPILSPPRSQSPRRFFERPITPPSRMEYIRERQGYRNPSPVPFQQEYHHTHGMSRGWHSSPEPWANDRDDDLF